MRLKCTICEHPAHEGDRCGTPVQDGDGWFRNCVCGLVDSIIGMADNSNL